MIRALVGCSLLLAILCGSIHAMALIPTPVGGHAGEWDANARVTLERGKVEPNENENSWQDARWEIYTLGAGYTYGDLSVLQDLFIRIEYSFVSTQSEVNQRSPVPAENCLGRAIAAETCEFYPEDRGSLVTPAVGFNLVHKPDFSFGLFVQGTIPISLNLEKFVTPRVDYLAGGVQHGVRLEPWFSVESRLYVGSGTLSDTQNSTVALTNLFGFEARRWLFPWKIGVKAGTYVDGDLSQRYDERYDAAYSAAGRRDRIRMFRFAVVLAPYFQITEHAALELGYVQKLFGYDTPATQFYSAGIRVAF